MASAATLTMSRPGPSSSSRSMWNVYRPDPATSPNSTRSSALYSPSEFTFNASWSPLTDVEFGTQVLHSQSQLNKVFLHDQKRRVIATHQLQQQLRQEDDRVSHLDFGSESESDAETINLKGRNDKSKSKDRGGDKRLRQDEEFDEGFYDFDEHFDGLDNNNTEAFLYYYTSNDSKPDPHAETNKAYLASYGYTNGLGYEKELGYGIGLGLSRKPLTDMKKTTPTPMSKPPPEIEIKPPVFARAIVRRISSVQGRRPPRDIIPITPQEVLLHPNAFATALCDKLEISKEDKLRTNPLAAWEDECWADLEPRRGYPRELGFDDYDESILDMTEVNDHEQDEAIEEEDWQAYTDVGVEFPPTSPTTPTTLASSARNSWLEHAGARAQAARHARSGSGSNARLAITLRFPNVPSHVPFPSSTPDTAIVDQQNFIRNCSASATFSNSTSAPPSVRGTPIDPVLTPTPAITPPLRLSGIYSHEYVPRYRPLSDPPPYTADAPPPPPPVSESSEHVMNGADMTANTETTAVEQERQPANMNEAQSSSRPQSPQENTGTFGPVRLSEILDPTANPIHSSTPDSAERAEVADNISPLPRSISPIYTLHGAIISPRPTFPPTHRSALSFPRSPTESISTLATLTSTSATSDATILTPEGISSALRFPFIRPQDAARTVPTPANNGASASQSQVDSSMNKRPLPVPPPPQAGATAPITPITPSSADSVYSVAHSSDMTSRTKRSTELEAIDREREIEDGGWISVRVSESEEIPITLAPVRSSHFHNAYPSQSISNFSMSSLQGGITESEVDISRLPWEGIKLNVNRRQPSPFRRLATLSRRLAPNSGSREK